MAVSTAGIAVKDGLLRELGGTAGYAVAGAGAAGEDLEVRERLEKWERIFADGRRTALKNGITEEVIAEEIRLYREEKRAEKK